MSVQARLTSLAQAIGADIKSLRASIASSLVWGGIGGVLANQTDLQAALDAKLAAADPRLCTAWVNFNGTGTVAIRGGYNVSSITDNGNGDYTLNFASAMQNANYAITFGALGGTLSNISGHTVLAGATATGANLKTTTSVRIQTGSSGTGGLFDSAEVNVAIYGGK